MSFRFFYSIPLYAFYFLPLNCFQKTVKSKHEIRNIHLNFCTVSFLILTPVRYEPAAHFYFDKLVKRYSSKIFNLHTSLCCCCVRFSWSIYRRVYWSCAQVSPISRDGCTKLKSFLVSFFYQKRTFYLLHSHHSEHTACMKNFLSCWIAWPKSWVKQASVYLSKDLSWFLTANTASNYRPRASRSYFIASCIWFDNAVNSI